MNLSYIITPGWIQNRGEIVWNIHIFHEHSMYDPELRRLFETNIFFMITPGRIQSRGDCLKQTYFS